MDDNTLREDIGGTTIIIGSVFLGIALVVLAASGLVWLFESFGRIGGAVALALIASGLIGLGIYQFPSITSDESDD